MNPFYMVITGIDPATQFEQIVPGINFILFLGLLYMFFQEKKTTTSQRIRLAAVCAVFSLCTAHLVCLRLRVDIFCKRSAVIRPQ
jgi:hypothetical protein